MAILEFDACAQTQRLGRVVFIRYVGNALKQLSFILAIDRHIDNRGGSRIDACAQTQHRGRVVFIRYVSYAWKQLSFIW